MFCTENDRLSVSQAGFNVSLQVIDMDTIYLHGYVSLDAARVSDTIKYKPLFLAFSFFSDFKPFQFRWEISFPLSPYRHFNKIT